MDAAKFLKVYSLVKDFSIHVAICNLTTSVLLEILVRALPQFFVLVVQESFAESIEEC